MVARVKYDNRKRHIDPDKGLQMFIFMFFIYNSTRKWKAMHKAGH